jgi:hypothetical protein
VRTRGRARPTARWSPQHNKQAPVLQGMDLSLCREVPRESHRFPARGVRMVFRTQLCVKNRVELSLYANCRCPRPSS